MGKEDTCGSASIDDRWARCRDALAARGQEHVLTWWPELDDDSRSTLLDEIESIPWSTIDPLLESHVRNRPAQEVPTPLEPASAHRVAAHAQRPAEYQSAERLGRTLIREGKLAAFTVAGGQGTRLGVDGPKGTVEVTPVKKKTLFQLFAETILASRERDDVVIPWYIMTNTSNHRQTVRFFETHAYFGLPQTDVMFFSQEMLPSFSFCGKLLMPQRHRLAWSPDGHGGALKSLNAGGALSDMRERGIEIISYFQVDNPLVQPFDALFIGLHRLTNSEMSTKVTAKTDDFERVGNLCKHDGRTLVVEYSSFPHDLASARNPDDTRKFDLGNLGIHLLDVEFVRKIAGEDFRLPYHRAEKAVTALDDGGFPCTPAESNAVKLETFVFDALPMATNPLLLEVERTSEFSPVKNAEGNDSLHTATRDQICRAAQWLEAAGLSVPRNARGEPNIVLEIAPAFALCAEDVRRHADRLLELIPGTTVYIT